MKIQTITLALTILLLGWSVSVSAQFRIEVPYAEENGKLVVAAEVNGCPGRFILDTGAPCALTHSFLQRAGKNGGQDATFQDSNGNLIESQIITLSHLKLGGTRFSQLQAVSLPAGNIIETFHIDGVIGYNLFRMGSLRLNGRKRTLVFGSQPVVEAQDSIHALRMIKDAYLTLLPVKIGKTACDTVMLDSGASGFYTLSEKGYRRLTQEKAQLKLLGCGTGTLSAGAAGVEQSTTKHRVGIKQFGLCQSLFKNVTTITTYAPYSRIGTGFLAHGDMAIDYKRGMFYFIPYDTGKTPDLYQPEWDVVIIAAQNKLVAGMVWDTRHTPLRGGEQIVEINGTSYAQPIDMYRAITHGIIPASADKLSIKYIDPDSGETRSAVIRKR